MATSRKKSQVEHNSSETQGCAPASKEEVFSTIVGMLSELLNMPTERFLAETEIFEDLPLDSLQLYELVVDLESQYAIRISDEAIEKVRTIQDVVDMICEAEQ